jgi:hypothetical protein
MISVAVFALIAALILAAVVLGTIHAIVSSK